MKKLSKELVIIYTIGLIVSCIVGIATHYVTGLWELSVMVAIIALYCFARPSVTTYFGLRRNPEYQKDTKEE